ncbi:hypothetical protein KSF_108880 [Reticulibacter mediterranei]|uniref:Baseplate protein J-like barrel domain-containing protein n=1 Tax=Reticulibacter mediterranei TaxID=2778369 RepID=A0A8J3N9Q4_9CHLR|nr:baseplate J/gp47 family protein [Reticulibacter mediterranei]GHP00841.1 hypothetical protein KSF_108880 [Reticulibacter mediterranei]
MKRKHHPSRTLTVYVEGTAELLGATPYRSPYHWLRVLVPIGLLFTCIVVYLGWGTTATVRLALATSTQERTITITLLERPQHPTESLLRHLTAVQTSTVTALATKRVHHPATQAKGVLTWLNQSSVSQTIPAGFSLALTPHLHVVTDATIVVPAAAPPALGSITSLAHSEEAGTQGNIAAGSLSQACPACGSGLTVTNLQAFTGGHDEDTESILQQSDIDHTVGQQQYQLLQLARSDLQQQLTKPEQFAEAAQCTTQIHTLPQWGVLQSTHTSRSLQRVRRRPITTTTCKRKRSLSFASRRNQEALIPLLRYR